MLCYVMFGKFLERTNSRHRSLHTEMPARAGLPTEVIFGRQEVRLYTFDDLEATGRVALKQRALNLRDMLGDDPSVPRLIPSGSPEQLGAAVRAALNGRSRTGSTMLRPSPRAAPAQCFGYSKCSACSPEPSGCSCLRRTLVRPLQAACRSQAGRSESAVSPLASDPECGPTAALRREASRWRWRRSVGSMRSMETPRCALPRWCMAAG